MKEKFCFENWSIYDAFTSIIMSLEFLSWNIFIDGDLKLLE